MHWVLEKGIFGSGCDLSDAARAAGHAVTYWDDAWWATGVPNMTGPTLFHGSLGNAARIGHELKWAPGAYCNTDAFHCTVWYPRASRWLLNVGWSSTSLNALVASPPDADAFFVRPDSPLKPFSGRILRRDNVTLAAVDHGFYFEDASLPVIVAPVRPIEAEWRYVVVDRKVVAGSAYAAEGRRALPDAPTAKPWLFAQDVATNMEMPELVNIIDVCASGSELRLLELNPFSGADLYACDLYAVVSAIASVVDA